jgi:hypothetical protein
MKLKLQCYLCKTEAHETTLGVMNSDHIFSCSYLLAYNLMLGSRPVQQAFRITCIWSNSVIKNILVPTVTCNIPGTRVGPEKDTTPGSLSKEHCTLSIHYLGPALKCYSFSIDLCDEG